MQNSSQKDKYISHFCIPRRGLNEMSSPLETGIEKARDYYSQVIKGTDRTLAVQENRLFEDHLPKYLCKLFSHWWREREGGKGEFSA